MSLNFNFQNVTNYQEVTTDPTDETRWHPVADALVWLSMICGYREITLKNVDKVISRVMTYQAVGGSYFRGVYITAQDIRRFVGMTTNASVMTDAQWAKRIARIATDQGQSLHNRLENAQTPSALSEIQRSLSKAE